MRPRVLVTGEFDNPGLADVRFLEHASRLGRVHVELWSDAGLEAATGSPPRLPEAERRYLLSALRYVDTVSVAAGPPPAGSLPRADGVLPEVWLDRVHDAARELTCERLGVSYRTVEPADLDLPAVRARPPEGSYPDAVVVTGCFDWLHSGHVRFFQDAARYGEVHVVVGHDANVRQLKGEGHPLFPDTVRRYLVGSVRDVRRAWIATGWGWLDAAPEIERIRPAVYLVNRDGDRPEKLSWCRDRGIRYVVLERTPHPGLPRRTSTDLRGF